MKAQVIEIPSKGNKGKYGEGNVRKRGERWQISYYDDNGRRRWESYSTELKATKALDLKLKLREAGKLDEPKNRESIDALAQLYLADRKGTSPKSYSWLSSVWNNHLEPFFGGFKASRITTEKMIEYRNDRLEAKASPTSINKELMILRAIYNHALDYTPPKIERIPKFPERLKEPPARSGFIDDKQFDALLENCTCQGLRALLLTAYTFGFRRAELVGRVDRNQPPMLVRQISLKNRTIDLCPGATKNEEARMIRMTEEVYAALKPCLEGKSPNDPVFTWPDGTAMLDFRGSWDRMCKAAGVTVRLHDFRRSATRNLIRAGVSRDVAKRITGHKTDSMFSRYNIVDDADLAKAAEQLEARRIGGKLVATSQQGS